MENKILSNRSAAGLKDIISGGKNTFAKKFPSGEVYVQVPEDVNEQDIHIICSFHRPELYHIRSKIAKSDLDEGTKKLLISDFISSVEDDIREIEKICDACKRNGGRSLSIYITQFPDARQDKKDEKGVPVSAKLFLDCIRTSAEPILKKIISVDIHSPQIQAMTNYPFYQIQTVYLFLLHLKLYYSSKDFIILLPDAGSYKRYEKIIKNFNLDYAIISKSRPDHGNSIAENYIGTSPFNRTVVIFDDIIDTGGTIINTARQAKQMGARDVLVYATHGIFSTKIKENENSKNNEYIFVEERFKEEGLKVYISDSVPRTNEYRNEHSKWLKQFTLAPFFAEIIECDEKNKSYTKIIDEQKKLILNGDKGRIEKEIAKFFIY
ncbi:MAG: ribose-phosphate diphosphokinase [Nanoarchaeota archaeon]